MKILAVIFLILLLISGVGFIFPEQFMDTLNSIFGTYSWAAGNTIIILTIAVAIIFVVCLIVERKKDRV